MEANRPRSDDRQPAATARPDAETQRAEDTTQHDGGTPESPHQDHNETTGAPPAVAQFETFARELTESVWQAISEELGDGEAAKEAKRQLANHGWCDLLIGVIVAIEGSRKLISKIPGVAKKTICRVVLGSSMQEKRPQLSERVIGAVVDKVWTAIKTVLTAKIPIFAAVNNDDLLRMLRILAIFSCPAPERHPELLKHAIDPLAEDVRVVLTDEVKEKLREVFGR